MAGRWSTHEDARLRALYAGGASLAVIAAELDRSEHAVTARRRLLGIDARRMQRPWSQLEDRILRAAADGGTPATVLAARLGRSLHDVRNRRRELGLTAAPARRYSAAEDAALRAAWAAGLGATAIAADLGRSADGVRLRAVALGLHGTRRRRRWGADEDATLRDGYAGGSTCEQIAATLTDRTPAAVAARARKLGLSSYARSWTAEDDAHLRALAAARPAGEIAHRLGRTPEAVRRRARLVGVELVAGPVAPRAGTRWTQDEDALLRLHAALNPAALATRLGRSDEAVVTRLRRLGLREGRERSPHHPAATTRGLTPGEWRLVDRELRSVRPATLLVLGRRLGRSPGELRRLLAERGAAAAPPHARAAAR